ncbi:MULTISPECIES: STAS domain-containing protein [Xanthomonas]|uniref:STAS domain-containing protein n=2 Tax=Xanthomonas TaxID=338 RepID=A0ABZ0JUK5_9XANT|nr:MULTISPECIES: STAS domain-containing protein [unclassified Xanthomonas]MBB5876445.1 anti-anti-sigma regulatory factor [Xanthomonas sp. 3498]MBO9829678.1 STAS domain-containing protein [Xanthomonas sp. A2111]MBO9871979.1 STAS domain-containing protein [Xanthomonas sp. D-93]MDS9991284.1 STAS domain-containing protein [Xanthomonas sp. A2111]MXV07572.1 STAS domain-containing protein [Xanthomonas sp. LMG 9002]
MSTVPLGEDLGIETSADLKQRLTAFLAADDVLRLDAGEVRRIHTASVQVLCAFVDARRKDGKRTEFEACNATFRDAARLLGVSESLGLPATPDNLKSVENAA